VREMPSKNKGTPQLFVGPLRQGEQRPVIVQGKKKRNRKAARNMRQGGPSRALPAFGASVAYAQGTRSGEPNFRRNGYRSTTISHRELVGSVSGSSTFAAQFGFSLQPGLATSFPWLSTQAVGWEAYRFKRLKYCYYTRCSTATPGSIMLIPDYNAADPPPLDEQTASAYRDVVEEVPWTVEFECELDPEAMCPKGQRRFVRTAGLAPNLDIKTYDSGSMYIGTVDGTGVIWGKIWVDYEVELFVPTLPTAPDVANSGSVASGGTVSKTSFFGTAPVTSPAAFAVIFSSGSSGMFLGFAVPGEYLVTLTISGTGLAYPTFTTAGPITVTTVGFTGSGSTTIIVEYLVTCQVSGSTINFADGGSSTVTGVYARAAPYLITNG